MSAILRQLRKHPDVLPVFVITILGAGFAGSAIIRSGWKYTDVSFRRKSNPHPWVHIKPDQQTKFLHMNDYKKADVRRPNYVDEAESK